MSSDAPLQGKALLDQISDAPLGPRKCETCDLERTPDQALQRCASCQAVEYCGRNCQSVHWPYHKAACKIIAKLRRDVENAARPLRSYSWDPRDPPKNFFEEQPGYFWGIVATRPYMHARNELAHTIAAMDNRLALEECLSHQFDMLRLSVRDNMGVREEMPGVMLRLGRDQECYDLIKWWALGYKDSASYLEEDRADFLNIKDADALEPIEPFMDHDFFSSSHISSLALLKIRLLLDLQRARDIISAAGTAKPTQEKAALLENAGLSNAITRQKDILLELAQDPEPRINDMKAQAKKAVAYTHEKNKYLWDKIINPGDDFGTPPTMFSVGSPEEADVVRDQNIRAWKGTPGAIATLASLR
ncbi:hypothetical protein ACRALDRAFT_1078894 [Sodiomyces alcalophilus JCM 7366]|uniref:uncharacterized protein n=1 Tax=Sodiomyces alcalophilus JCM 7366 TaxID=591952 RepID=UPI0039B4C71A